VVDVVAEQVVEQVDSLLEKKWSRREGAMISQETEATQGHGATCSCGSGIPVQKVLINQQEMTLVALPLIFQKFQDAKKTPSEAVLNDIMEMVKIYNGIEPGDEIAIRQAVAQAYQTEWQKKEEGHA
jgi:hypothetical protein